MNPLHLHIGTHKTATTSVQRFMAANRDLLREHGLLYPDNSLGGFPEHHTHHHIAHAMAGKQRQGTPDDARRFFDNVRSELAPGERAVISAESLYRHVLPLARRPEQPAVNAGGKISGDPLGYIRTVRDCLGDFDVTVMVMLRRQDSFLESLYAEAVLNSSFEAPIEEFVVQRGWLADYQDRLGMWAEVFGADRLSVRAFEPKTFGMSVEQHFLEWVGVGWDDRFRMVGKHNVTVPRSLVEFKRRINDDQPKAIANIYRRWLERLVEDDGAEDLPDIDRYYFAAGARARLMERFEPGNRELAQRYLGRDELFTEAAPTGYDEPRALGNDEFVAITRLLMRSLAHHEARRG